MEDEGTRTATGRSTATPRRLTAVPVPHAGDQDLVRPPTTEFAARLEQLSLDVAGLRLGEVEDILATVVDLACRTIPGVEGAGVLARPRNGVRVVAASSDDTVRHVDRRQVALVEGPAVDALGPPTTPAPAGPHPSAPPAVEAVDLRDARGAGGRWPRFAAEARCHGFRGALSLPLWTPTQGGPRHALTVYGGGGGGFTGGERALAASLAAHAGAALAAARDRARLLAALESRDVIGQAKGILMQRHALDADGAFARLVAASQRANLKLRDVAAWLVDDLSGRSSG